ERLIGRAGAASLTVNVAGLTVHVRHGTTLADLVTRFALRPRAGDILDVSGRPFERGAVPGQLLVDGRTAAAGLRLRAGDSVTVVPGRDRREPLARRFPCTGWAAAGT